MLHFSFDIALPSMSLCEMYVGSHFVIFGVNLCKCFVKMNMNNWNYNWRKIWTDSTTLLDNVFLYFHIVKETVFFKRKLMFSKLVGMLFTMLFLFALVVDGQWSTWSSWSTCSPDCKHHRRRLCDNPAQENGGRFCHGTDLDTANCTGAMCKGRSSSTFSFAPRQHCWSQQWSTDSGIIWELVHAATAATYFSVFWLRHEMDSAPNCDGNEKIGYHGNRR